MSGAWVLLTMGFAWLGALCVWLFGKRHPRALDRIAAVFAILSALASLALVPFASARVELQMALGGAFGDFTFTPDGLGVTLACVATSIGALTVLFSFDYMREESQRARYYALILIFIGGMVGLVLTSSLLLLFFFWEIVALCSYALIAFHNDDPKAVAAGIKALVITQIGGVGLLITALLTYVESGSYEFSALRAHAATMPREVLAVLAFGCLVAAAAKSAQVPFHTWLPDAMQAPTPVSALIHAATMVNAGIYLLARFYAVFAPVPLWTTSVIVVGIVSMLLAGVMALVADDLKRVLAYSTISQLGLMVCAIGSGALVASQFHLVNHAVFKALLFLSAGAVIYLTGTRDLNRLGGWSKAMPFVRNAFVVGALALAGVPILNGFWSKELILDATARQGNWLLTILLLIGAGLTALYTARVTWRVFFAPPSDSTRARNVNDAPTAMRIVLAVLVGGAFTTWLGIGNFSALLVETQPYGHLEAQSVSAMAMEIFSTPLVYAALAIPMSAFLIYRTRKRWRGFTSRAGWIISAAENSFGFEWVNSQAASITLGMASVLRRTQTGQLNWNAAGILVGLLLVLLVLVAQG